jgi:hypothetical protein
MREKNYEKILAIYNDCFQGKVTNLFFNFAGTKEVLENERRGLFSYSALKSRLHTNKFENFKPTKMLYIGRKLRLFFFLNQRRV